MFMNPGLPISIYEIAQLAGKAFPKTVTISNIQKGFEVSGLFPVNENIFGEHEFLSSDVTGFPLNEAISRQPAEQQETTKNIEIATPSNFKFNCRQHSLQSRHI